MSHECPAASAKHPRRREIAVWTAASDPAITREPVAFSFDLPPLLNPTLRVLELAHPVHRPDVGDPAPARRATVAVFRHPETHRVMWRELDGLSARFIGFARTRRASSTTLCREIAEQVRAPLDEAFVAGIAAALASWLEERSVLGSEPDEVR